ncbi:hypothetical protein JOM56_013124 [Amanita muscaria]
MPQLPPPIPKIPAIVPTAQALSNVPPTPSLTHTEAQAPSNVPPALSLSQFKLPAPIAHSFNQDIPEFPGPSENEPFTQDPPAGSSNDNIVKSSQKENINLTAPIAALKKKGKQSTKQAVTDNAITPKNLFKKHWLTLPGNTLESEFVKAWTSLQPEEKKVWKDQSMALKITRNKKISLNRERGERGAERGGARWNEGEEGGREQSEGEEGSGEQSEGERGGREQNGAVAKFPVPNRAEMQLICIQFLSESRSSDYN